MYSMPTLKDISFRFEEAVRQNPGQPLMCYALDENRYIDLRMK